MRVTGQCHCGAITYTAELDPNRIGLCHCADCQVLGGGAFNVSALVAKSALEITSGTPQVYEKAAASGRVRCMNFCGICSTMLFSGPKDGGEDASVSLRAMTCDRRSSLTPSAEIWCESRLAWVPAVESAPFKFDTQPDLS